MIEQHLAVRALVLFGGSQVHLQRVRDGMREMVACQRQRAGEGQQLIAPDADVGVAGAQIDDSDGVAGRVGAVAQLQQAAASRERFHVNCHRLEAGCKQHVYMPVDHVLLRNGQQHFHVLRICRHVRPLNRLEVHDDLVRREWGLPIHFPLHRLGQFGVAHARHINHAHDHRLPGNRTDALPGGDARLAKQFLDRLPERLRVHNDVILKGFLRRRSDAYCRNLHPIIAAPDFDCLNLLCADVQPNGGSACHALFTPNRHPLAPAAGRAFR